MSQDHPRPEAPLVSVIVPTHNRRNLLHRAVATVVAQSSHDLEVVVVNDGGTDVGRFSDPRVRVIARPVSGGAARARNAGMHQSRGRYLTFLDDDDELLPDRLETSLRAIDRAPVILSWKARLGTTRPTWSRVLEGRVPGELLSGPVPQLGCALVDRRVALPFDESFSVSEDVEWWIRMGQAVNVYTVPAVGYLLRDHAGPRLTARTESRLEHRLRLLEMHAGFFAHYPRAASYHWRRAGGMAAAVGDRELSRRCFWRSFRVHPSPRTALSAARVFSHLAR